VWYFKGCWLKFSGVKLFFLFKIDGTEYVYEGSIHERPRNPGTDVYVCFDEVKISVTQMAVGTTNQCDAFYSL